jgi:ketosteroid isomerase-like protein
MSTHLPQMTVTRDADGAAVPALDQSWSDDDKVSWRCALAAHDTGIKIRAVTHQGQDGYNLLVGRSSYGVDNLQAAFRSLADVTTGAEQARPAVLSEVGRTLMKFSEARTPKGPREAALWDAACHVVEKMGDGNWRADR